MSQPRVGVIGGSGLYAVADLEQTEEIVLTTPFGDPSDAVVVGRWHGVEVAFIPRHGRGHRIMPSHINARANIFALKSLGVEWLISVSAVGSMREELIPGDVVIPDQFVDRTNGRASTFFGRGLVAHVSFAHPVCPALGRIAYESAAAAGATVHRGGTYVCMEGPQFSTLAESRLYRSWGMDIIGMTNLQEAKLAREAEICYTTLALVTDYDCWHEGHDEVTVEMIVANLLQNARTAQQVIAEAVSRLPIDRTCECATALATSLITEPEVVPANVREDLALIVGKYLK